MGAINLDSDSDSNIKRQTDKGPKFDQKLFPPSFSLGEFLLAVHRGRWRPSVANRDGLSVVLQFPVILSKILVSHDEGPSSFATKGWRAFRTCEMDQHLENFLHFHPLVFNFFSLFFGYFCQCEALRILPKPHQQALASTTCMAESMQGNKKWFEPCQATNGVPERKF